jgi:hypothetical protein
MIGSAWYVKPWFFQPVIIANAESDERAGMEHAEIKRRLSPPIFLFFCET